MAGAKFNTIVVVDAIPDWELNTARRLHGHLLDIANSVEGLDVRYSRVNTLQDLASLISALTREVAHGVLPSLHIEAHGFADERGFLTAQNEPCLWEAFKDMVTPLNVATNLNLMVMMAACYGGSFARAIRTTDRAPVWGVLGPTRDVTAGQIEDGFSAFYSAIFQEVSEFSPFRALAEHVPRGTYHLTTAEEFFYQVWINYRTEHCTEDELSQRAKAIHHELRRRGGDAPEVSAIRKHILDKDPQTFENFRDHYFMYDLDKQNRERYPVTYEEATKRLALTNQSSGPTTPAAD